jgi:glycosyltransferase involved in cell wall biosynthesis
VTPIQPTRIAILSYSDGRFDGRSRRIAQSARSAGYTTVVYARWEPGLPFVEDVNGLRIVRAPVDWRRAVPGLRGLARRAFARERAAAAAGRSGPPVELRAPRSRLPDRTAVEHLRAAARSPREYAIRGAAWVSRVPRMAVRGVVGPLVLFPIRPIAWAAAVEDVAEPADIWHGMWAGSLPALARLRARHGGVTVYDSRDVYLHARIFDRMQPWLRSLFRRLERGWARAADLVVTVNDAYADILVPLLGVARPIVVRNCPDPYEPEGPRPDRIRALLALPAEVAVVLYQGGLMTERGIEEGMDAILRVPGAVFVIMGYGSRRAAYVQSAREPSRSGRVRVIDPVPPEDLLEWTASADVMLMAIQPTTLNHRYTTPQKLWEAIAAGVPVVASDLPGMAQVVQEVGCGALCDPTDPESIAAAIRDLLGRPVAERDALRERTLDAARRTYNWDAQARTLLAAYARLLAPEAASRS